MYAINAVLIVLLLLLKINNSSIILLYTWINILNYIITEIDDF